MSSVVAKWMLVRETSDQLSLGNCIARVKTNDRKDASDAWTPWIEFDSFRLEILRSILDGAVLWQPTKRDTSTCLTVSRTIKCDESKIQLPTVAPLRFLEFDLSYSQRTSGNLYPWDLILPIVHQTIVPVRKS